MAALRIAVLRGRGEIVRDINRDFRLVSGSRERCRKGAAGPLSLIHQVVLVPASDQVRVGEFLARVGGRSGGFAGEGDEVVVEQVEAVRARPATSPAPTASWSRPLRWTARSWSAS